MSNTPEEHPEKIDSTFRNGTMTALGVLLAFSLGFVIQWVSSPTPWHLIDLAALAPMMAGIAMQLIALERLLRYDSLEKARYDRACRDFMIGMVLTTAGITVALVIDVVQTTAAASL